MPSVSQQDQPLPGSLEEAQQRYETTKKALKAGLVKKRQIDRALTDLESQIFLFEGSYLASTASSGGNIVKGFDNYLKATTSTGYGSKAAAAAAAAAAPHNPQEVPIEDRMFSLSSGTYARSLQLKASEGRSREQSPAIGGKKGEKSEKTEKSTTKEKSKGSTAAASGEKEAADDKKEKATGGGDQTPQPSKGKKRDKEKDAATAAVNGSHKKKRKDDD